MQNWQTGQGETISPFLQNCVDEWVFFDRKISAAIEAVKGGERDVVAAIHGALEQVALAYHGLRSWQAWMEEQGARDGQGSSPEAVGLRPRTTC